MNERGGVGVGNNLDVDKVEGRLGAEHVDLHHPRMQVVATMHSSCIVLNPVIAGQAWWLLPHP